MGRLNRERAAAGWHPGRRHVYWPAMPSARRDAFLAACAGRRSNGRAASAGSCRTCGGCGAAASAAVSSSVCGGLAMALGLRPRRALLNDVNPHLIGFYRQLARASRSACR